jgi:hypothetical protein
VKGCQKGRIQGRYIVICQQAYLVNPLLLRNFAEMGIPMTSIGQSDGGAGDAAKYALFGMIGI